jgi:hypothetical protein
MSSRARLAEIWPPAHRRDLQRRSLPRIAATRCSPLDGGTIIHTRSCNIGVPLNTTSPGQPRGRAGASLLTADRLSWRVDLLTRLIYVPLGDS